SRADLILATNTINTGWHWVKLRLVWLLVLIAPLGCSGGRIGHQQAFAPRVLPPVSLDGHREVPATRKLTDDTSRARQAQFEQPDPPDESDNKVGELPVPAQDSAANLDLAQTLTLPEAIDTAFRHQPRLRGYLEGVEQARRGEDIAFVPYVPLAAVGF